MFNAQAYGKVSVLVPDNGGVVPYGNTVVVRGSEGTLVIDPSLALDRDPVGADLVLISHGHEDHFAGLRHFDAPTFAHHLDAPSVASLETMLTQYGLGPAERLEVERVITQEYGIPPTHERVAEVGDGHVFDLGDRTATVIHLPGHTPGHSGVLIEPDGFLASIDHAATIGARWYGTFHHKGVIMGSDEFRKRLTIYRDKTFRREDRLLEFLGEPRTIDDIVAHRLVYRPHVKAPYVDAVERRTAQLHLERLVTAGVVTAAEDGEFRRAP
jgi:glyoxylase-like metal-dependent hydrolase (beta-lactamase superfamily II)